MSTKHYVDVDGRYLGGYDGAAPPAGAVEVLSAPSDAAQVWSGSAWGALTDAQRAARLSLSASDFFIALGAQSIVDFSGRTSTTKRWTFDLVAASALPSSTKLTALELIESATDFYRSDPDRPGLMEAVASILPRSGGGTGLTSAEIDTIFLSAAGG